MWGLPVFAAWCGVAAVVGVVARLAPARWRSSEPADLTRESAEELGYLRHGRRGIVDVSVARMLTHGGLRPTRRGTFTLTDPVPAHPLDVAVRRAARGGRTLPELRIAAAATTPVRDVAHRAVARGWAHDPRTTLVGLGAQLVLVALVLVAPAALMPDGTPVRAGTLALTCALLAWPAPRWPWRSTRAGRVALRRARRALASPGSAATQVEQLGGARVLVVALAGLRAYPDADVVAAITTTPDVPLGGPSRSAAG